MVGHPQLWACVQLFLREPQAISFASGLGNHPVRRILGPVFLPTIAGLGLMFACGSYREDFSLTGLLPIAIFQARTVNTSHNQWTRSDMVSE
jgi:hypothetical protein